MFMYSVILSIVLSLCENTEKYHFVTYCKTLDFVFVTLFKTQYNVFIILGQSCIFDIVTFILISCAFKMFCHSSYLFYALFHNNVE